MKTTLKKLKKHDPCETSWKKGLKHLGKTESDSEPIKILDIIDVLGIKDAQWALRAVSGWDKEIRLYAADCAEHVLHIYEKKYPKNLAPRAAILAARDYSNGKISKEKLRAAYAAADVAADAAAGYAADAAYAASYAASYAVDAAAAYAADDAAACAAAGYAADAAADDAVDAAAAGAAKQKEIEWQKEKLIEYLKIVKEPTKEI